HLKRGRPLKGACQNISSYNVMRIVVTRMVTNCALTATEVTNTIYFLGELTGTGMSRSPAQQLSGVGSLPGGSTLPDSSTGSRTASDAEPGETAGTSSVRKRSSRFSRAFGMLPIAKPKPTNPPKQPDSTQGRLSRRSQTLPSESQPPVSNVQTLSPVTSDTSPLYKNTTMDTEDSDEFEFIGIKNCQRSVSLKSKIMRPGTPRQKKAVRFADALGLDLTSVFQILDNNESPIIAEYTLRNVEMQSYDPMTDDCYLMPLFSQPACLPNFLNFVRTLKVLLENCLVHDGSQPSISGTVRVSNIGYHKEVIIHYTIDRWVSSKDLEATYVPNSSDGLTDRFSFHIILPSNFQHGSRLEMAVKYVVNGQTFWDNNHSNNYVVECYGMVHTETNDDDDDPGWLHFF
ncbi:Glycogen-binding subunit 76A, partial [Lamellibrachia satsuma]